MKTLSVSEFRAACYSVLEDVSKNKTQVLITKRGKPIAEVIPYYPDRKEIPLGDTVVFMDDIICFIVIPAQSLPQRREGRESRKWGNPTFYETINIQSSIPAYPGCPVSSHP